MRSMTKEILTFVATIFSFMFCNIWATNVMKEPKIVKINDKLIVYENAARKITERVEKIIFLKIKMAF